MHFICLILCFISGVVCQQCIETDPCEPVYPCTLGDLMSDPTNCSRFHECVAPYEYRVTNVNCGEDSKGPFSNVTCRCDQINECHTWECPPSSITPGPPIQSEPCFTDGMECSNNNLTVADRYYCTRYFKCHDGDWWSETCPSDHPFYNVDTPEQAVPCSNNIARCSSIPFESCVDLTTLKSITTTEQITTDSTTIKATTTLLYTTTEKSTLQTTTTKPSTLQTTTTEPSTLQTTTTEPSTLQTTTTKPSTLQTTTTEPSTLQTTTTKPSTLQTTTTEPSTLQTITTKPSTLQTKATKPSTLQTTTTEPSTLQMTTTEPSTTTLHFSRGATDVELNSTEPTMLTYGPNTSLSTHPSSSVACEPLETCTNGQKVAHIYECSVFFQCEEDLWEANNCTQMNSKKPFYDPMKQKCQKKLFVDCAVRCNLDTIRVAKSTRNILIITICCFAGVSLIVAIVLAALPGCRRTEEDGKGYTDMAAGANSQSTNHVQPILRTAHTSPTTGQVSSIPSKPTTKGVELVNYVPLQEEIIDPIALSPTSKRKPKVDMLDERAALYRPTDIDDIKKGKQPNSPTTDPMYLDSMADGPRPAAFGLMYL